MIYPFYALVRLVVAALASVAKPLKSVCHGIWPCHSRQEKQVAKLTSLTHIEPTPTPEIMEPVLQNISQVRDQSRDAGLTPVESVENRIQKAKQQKTQDGMQIGDNFFFINELEQSIGNMVAPKIYVPLNPTRTGLSESLLRLGGGVTFVPPPEKCLKH